LTVAVSGQGTTLADQACDPRQRRRCPAINGDQTMPEFDEEATMCEAVQPEASLEMVGIDSKVFHRKEC
jgi:hypothetical protein